MSGFEVRKRTQYGMCCMDCGSVVRSSQWRPSAQEAEKYRERAELYGCRTCENRRKVAALPLHHAHHQHNPDWPYPGDHGARCCAAVQLGHVNPFDCEECGEHYPCATTKAATK